MACPRPTPTMPATSSPTSLASGGVITNRTTNTYDGSGNLLTTQAPGNQWTTNTWDGEIG